MILNFNSDGHELFTFIGNAGKAPAPIGPAGKETPAVCLSDQ